MEILNVLTKISSSMIKIRLYAKYFRKNQFFQFRAMKLPLRPGCRANCFASFGPVYSLIGSIWTHFIKNPKIIKML